MLMKSAKRNGSLLEPLVKRRVLIIDDHPLMRRGLTALINNEPDLEVCADADGPRAGLEAIASSQPDLVITDLSMGDGGGFSLLEDIRSGNKDLPILILSKHDGRNHVRRALSAGANGYVSKPEMGEVLLDAIRSVLGGETYLSPKVMADSASK